MSQVTVFSGVERRRVWTAEQKQSLVAAVCEPGANVAEIARQADLRPSQLYRWRRDLAGAKGPGFAAVTVRAEPGSIGSAAAIVVEFGGAVLRIAADAPPALVAAVVRSLRR